MVNEAEHGLDYELFFPISKTLRRQLNGNIKGLRQTLLINFSSCS